MTNGKHGKRIYEHILVCGPQKYGTFEVLEALKGECKKKLNFSYPGGEALIRDVLKAAKKPGEIPVAT